jgi:hypothetical protein
MGQKRAFEIHEAYSGVMGDLDSDGLLRDLRNMVNFTLIKDKIIPIPSPFTVYLPFLPLKGETTFLRLPKATSDNVKSNADKVSKRMNLPYSDVKKRYLQFVEDHSTQAKAAKSTDCLEFHTNIARPPSSS